MRNTHLLMGAGFLLSPLSIALAQETETNVNSDVERIQITGSNIRGVDLEGTQPLSIISAEDIKKSGANSVFDLLKDLGQTRGGNGTFSTSESGGTSNSTPAGQAAASLRGLGPASTLTLINGRRVAPSSFAAGTENFVDINSIPLAAIERIEVLATGASAIYGADAVAGVINYILKKDYEGAEINVSYEDSTESTDESKKNINIVWGTQAAGGYLTLFADLYDKNAFAATDRSFTKDPVLVNSYSYLSKLPYPNVYFNSARSGNELPNPDCPTATTRTEFGEDICAYYGNGDDLLDSELESQSLGLIYTKEFSGLTWATDVFYSRTESVAVSSPAPINQIDDSEGPFVPFSVLDIYTDAQLESWLGSSDPFDALWDDPFDTPAGQELFGFAFDARFQDPRTVEVETDSLRLVSSLKGDWGDWQWETGITYSESKSDQTAIAGVYNRYKFHAAIAGELCSDGSIASYNAASDSLACAGGSPLARYNPFQIGNSQNDSILALAQEMPTRKGKSRVYGIDAKFNGEVMEFGDDYIRAAIGIEFRKEKLEDIPSANSRADFDKDFLVDVFGFGSSFAEADRTQIGAFAEFYIPLAENLDMQLAGRFDDFDDFGSTFNPKVGFTYRPADSLVLRASWATSFRAPSLTQAGVELRTTTSTFDCAANQAVADLYCEGFGDERNPNTLELGNPNLEAEESDSYSAGFAWSPTDDTTITVDYWRFDHEKIVDTNMTGILARAIDDASLRHCGLVPAGEIGISYDPDLCLVTDASGRTIEEDGANLTEILEAWDNFDTPRFVELPLFRDHIIPLENTGNQTVEGLDLKLSQDFDLYDGTLGIDVDWTHYLSFERNKPGSDEIEELVGTFRYPENIASARFSWGNDFVYGGISVRYTDGYADDIEGLRGREIDELESLGELDANGNRDISSWTVVDANLGFDFEHSLLNFNIDNLFDEEPPRIYGSRRGFDSINHDALGRTFRVSYTYFFK